jgi:hypothetical protein
VALRDLAEDFPMRVGTEPARKTPITTQHMWEIACDDYTTEAIRLNAVRSDPSATPAQIASFERRLRIRHAICNAIDFLITNADDINAVIAARRGRAA